MSTTGEHVVFVLDDSNREIARTETWDGAHDLCVAQNDREYAQRQQTGIAGERWSFAVPIEYAWLCNE